jgi:hypothetical protein
MLLSVYSVYSQGAQPRLYEGGRRFGRDFAAAVLLFTFIGAIIDFATFLWIDIWDMDDFKMDFLIVGGLTAIAISACVVAYRYLGMTWQFAMLAGCVATIVNLVAWPALMFASDSDTLLVCLPIVVVSYVLFLVFLRRTRINLNTRRVPEQVSGIIEIAMAKRPVERPSSGGPPIAWGPRRKRELLIANLVFITILIFMPVAFYIFM